MAQAVRAQQAAELRALAGVRQRAVQQQKGAVEEVAALRQLLDGVPPVQQLALLAVYVRHLRGALARHGAGGTPRRC